MRALRKGILRWYARNKRDLPWRRTKDPYAIWISEVMLQQTRVETVIPYFARWMARFPSIGALARASLDDVFAVWQGLGYYARARNLHAAARLVARKHAGAVPREREARLALPGVGAYTAGAIGSIAFGLPEPVLDGNVERVLTRLLGMRGNPRRAAARARLWREASRLAEGPDPGALNQALMEIGARLCLPDEPVCDRCPLARACAAKRLGLVHRIPALPRRVSPTQVLAGACRIARRGRWLVVRRPPGGLLGGLWELPGADGSGPAALGRAMRRALGLEVDVGEKLTTVTHLFTHRRLRLDVYEATLLRAQPIGVTTRWVRPADLARLPMSRLHRRVVESID